MVFQTKRYKKVCNKYCRNKSKLKGVCTTKNPPYPNATDLNANGKVFIQNALKSARTGRCRGVRIDAGKSAYKNCVFLVSLL